MSELDTSRLTAWLAVNVPGATGPLTITRYPGGQSNPTYRIGTNARTLVLRRKPPGPLLKGAHAVEREARIMAALHAAAFPVPRVHALCEDADVLGTPFFVMDEVPGRIFWNAALPDLAPPERAAVFDAMNATLARLHRLDPAALGLADYGRPGDYFARQIARWGQQYETDLDAPRLPDMERLIAWLRDHAPPPDETALTHGDYRIDNLIFAPDRAQVAAVIDWELSTLGHPLADFAYHAMMFRTPPRYPGGLLGTHADGIPTEADYVAAYCARTGRDGIPGLDYLIAFSFFRIVAILHGIAGRVARGTAASPQARERAATLPDLAALALAQTR